MTYAQPHPQQQHTEAGVLRTGTLVAATITTGLLAGIFTDWSNTIMPGLGNVDDRSFVVAQQALNEAITNPLFLGGFTVALLLIGLSAALHLRRQHRRALPWIGAALVAYLVTNIVTFGIHEPLNQQFMAAAETAANGADFAAARAQLDEAMWTTWNTVRAVATTIAFGCLTWALVIHRRPGR